MTQDRFAADDTAKASTHGRCRHRRFGSHDRLDANLPWHGSPSSRARSRPTWPSPRTPRPIVNAGQTAYFRTLYDTALFAKIDASFVQLLCSRSAGHPLRRRALGYSGYAPLANLFVLARKVTPDFDPVVQRTVAGRFQGVSELYDGLPGQAAFKAFGRRVLEPLFVKVGWTAKPGEAQNVTLLRAGLLSALSELDDPAVIGEAQKRFQDYLRNPASLSPEIAAQRARHRGAACGRQNLGCAPRARQIRAVRAREAGALRASGPCEGQSPR